MNKNNIAIKYSITYHTITISANTKISIQISVYFNPSLPIFISVFWCATCNIT